MAEIIQYPGLTVVEDLPEKILQAAADAKLKKVVVVGRERDGNFWFSGNFSDAYEILWLLEVAKRELISLMEDEE